MNANQKILTMKKSTICQTQTIFILEILNYSQIKNSNAAKYHVVQYFAPNKETSPEEYAHHMLYVYYPFRDEKELASGNPPTYAGKLAELGVAEVANQNYPLIEPFVSIVDDAFERLSSHNDNNMGRYDKQENDEVSDKHTEYSENLDRHF